MLPQSLVHRIFSVKRGGEHQRVMESHEGPPHGAEGFYRLASVRAHTFAKSDASGFWAGSPRGGKCAEAVVSDSPGPIESLLSRRGLR